MAFGTFPSVAGVVVSGVAKYVGPVDVGAQVPGLAMNVGNAMFSGISYPSAPRFYRMTHRKASYAGPGPCRLHVSR